MSIRNTLALIALGAVPFSAACGGGEAPKPAAPPSTAAPAGAPAAQSGTASISGKISFEGTMPAGEKVKLGADPRCQELHPNGLERKTIEGKDGGLADVLVYVKSGASGTFPAPAEPVVLDQHGCAYNPHVVVVHVGQKLLIKNSDDTLHNVHPRPAVNEEFNIGQPKKGMESTRTFDKPEIMFPVGCDVHPWMRAFMAVVSNPFHAVTAEDGTFTIKGLPAGEFEIEAAHGKLKTMSGKVTVKDGEAAQFNLAFKG